MTNSQLGRQTILATGVNQIGTTDVAVSNHWGGQCVVYIDITAVAGGTLTLTIQDVGGSGTKATLLASTTLIGAGLTVLQISPNLTASANLIATRLCSADLNFHIVVAAGTVTGTITAYFMP